MYIHLNKIVHNTENTKIIKTLLPDTQAKP